MTIEASQDISIKSSAGISRRSPERLDLEGPERVDKCPRQRVYQRHRRRNSYRYSYQAQLTGKRSVMSDDFIGRGWAFPVRPDKTGGIALVSRERELAESIELILRTPKGDRPMRPRIWLRYLG